MGILTKFANWYFTKRKLPYWVVLILDSTIVAFSLYVAYYIQFGASGLFRDFHAVTLGMLVTLVLFVVSFRIFHTYSGLLRYSSFVDLERIALSDAVGAVFVLAVSLLFGALDIESVILPNYRSCLIIFAGSTLLMWLERVLIKSLYDQFWVTENAQKTFIYGVRAGGVSLAKDVRNQTPVVYELCGFIAPEPEGKADLLMGVRVYNDDEHLLDVIRRLGIQVVLVSPLETDRFRTRTDLVDALLVNGVHIKVMSGPEEWDGKSDLHSSQLREVEIEDLLPRDKIEISMQTIAEQLTGHSILITGAAGSIGSEIVSQVARFRPSNLILIDQAETPMHDVRMKMCGEFHDITCETIVASITNAEHMENVFAKYRPEYVFHAAAYKHVPMMEDNPAEAVQNNIRGTRIIADLSVKYGVRKFVMVSTDKAVNPSNVMGCSKRICEIYCQSLNSAVEKGEAPAQVDGSPAVTRFVTTRFGNVLGSNGSVIPLFREQIKHGGPVTVTHPDIIRYFMLIPEACSLVLEAGAVGKGGEIFVFDMGDPVRIADLAARMIRLSGAQNIPVVYTGLRDGEKLYEEMLSDKELSKPTTHPKIRIAAVREYDYREACANEERLLKVSYTYDDMAIVRLMKEIVPEYKSLSSKYSVLDS